MLAATVSHREFAAQRLPGVPRVRVSESTSDVGHTVIEIVTDDAPFLVDSVTAALAARDLGVHVLVHPVMVVRRGVLGGLEEIRLGVEPEVAGFGDVVESWIRPEIDRIRDHSLLGEIRAEVARVLTDVRVAVEDWPKMRSQAPGLAEELTSAHLPVPDKDITDSVELLRWLVRDHFIFLGYREYRLVEGEDGEKLLQAVPGAGLGILRSDQSAPRVLSSISPEAYAKAPERRLLIIPFPAAINPLTYHVQEHTCDWAYRFGLVRGAAAVRGFKRVRLGYLAGRTHPTVRGRDPVIVAGLSRP